jgi:predicted AAA+ superfamily ATPase
LYITREIEGKIRALFASEQSKGLILAGIVGCGKTTLIEKLLADFAGRFECFRFTGDDVLFREAIRLDSKHLFNLVKSKSSRNALIFIDEIQKCEEVFDAVKYAFDHGSINFIVSGSNPEFLASQARKRLQRRASFFELKPFSMVEILQNKKLIDGSDATSFVEFLMSGDGIDTLKIPQMTCDEKIEAVCLEYMVLGGLPLSVSSESEWEALSEIQKTVERGFDPIYHESHDLFDQLVVDMGRQHSKEFSYQGIFQRTGLRRRDIAVKIINELRNHGYLQEKRPYFRDNDERRSYLVVYSWVDPGIVSYVTGVTREENIGFRLEGAMHTRMRFYQQFLPLKSQLHYFKPYKIDSNDKVKFQPGEIDFIWRIGNRHIPLEVKSVQNFSAIDTTLLQTFMREYRCPYGVVLYGGVPYLDRARRIIFWPYWLF